MKRLYLEDHNYLFFIKQGYSYNPNTHMLQVACNFPSIFRCIINTVSLFNRNRQRKSISSHKSKWFRLTLMVYGRFIRRNISSSSSSSRCSKMFIFMIMSIFVETQIASKSTSLFHCFHISYQGCRETFSGQDTRCISRWGKPMLDSRFQRQIARRLYSRAIHIWILRARTWTMCKLNNLNTIIIIIIIIKVMVVG